MKTTTAITPDRGGPLWRILRSCAALLALGALFAFAVPTAPALAQSAVTVADLNMRAGPSTQYPVIVVLRRGSPVQLHSCTQGGGWCNVSHRGATGWVSGRYLDIGRPVAPRRGGVFPFISFQIETYPHYYETRPYRDYRHRDYRRGDRYYGRRDYRAPRGYYRSYGTQPRQGGIAPRQGGIPPRSSVRTHIVPPPVMYDYDVAARSYDPPREYMEPQHSTRESTITQEPTVQTTPPRRTSRLATPELAEPQRLERRRD
ncbi:MAG: SH3 domain-containing protein [Salinarimonas sp.]|nr:SH3 domain-containing protein [Salinarimonas sp.]